LNAPSSSFLVTTLLIGTGAAICTWARARGRSHHRQLLGELVYAIGLASLMPLRGCILLILGEAVRVLRLIGAHGQVIHQFPAGWGSAFRQEVAKWGLFVTMIAFTITLTDRLAEYLTGASVLVWAGLNLPSFNREKFRNPAR
jgi:hypothetical protein